MKQILLPGVAFFAAATLLSSQPGSAQVGSCCSPPKLPGTASRTAAATVQKDGTQKATVIVDGGYSPASLTVKAGKPVEITFVRKSKGGCDGDVVFPSLNIKKSLKPGEKTVVRFTPGKSGSIAFTCGMGMYKGQVVAQQQKQAAL